MRKKLLLSILAFLLAAPLLAAAATTTPSGAANVRKDVDIKATGTKATTTSKAIKNAIKRCPIIESKIQVKVTAFDNTKIRHLTVYNNLKERLAKIADRLTARSADVSALRAALAVLDQKIAKFNADYAIYIAKMKASQEFVCGRSEGQFKTQLKETKVALAQVHKDAADIRAYFNATIKTEIKKIRDIIKTPATTTPATATSTRATSSDESREAKKIKPIVPRLLELD